MDISIDRQKKQISRLTNKAAEQNDTIKRLQEKTSDLGYLEQYLGKERVQSIVEQSKIMEQAERMEKCQKRAFDIGR